MGYGAPLDNLRRAMADAGLQSVDLWIGTGGLPVARLVVPLVRPKAFLPIHWDGLWEPFEAGLPWPFADAELEAYLAQSGIRLLRPAQYMDKWPRRARDRAGAEHAGETPARIQRSASFHKLSDRARRRSSDMLKALGILVACYTLWAAIDGKVYAKQSGLRGLRHIHKVEEPTYSGP